MFTTPAHVLEDEAERLREHLDHRHEVQRQQQPGFLQRLKAVMTSGADLDFSPS
ncbi:hypothetical protein ACFV7R_44315 [Streptomyces sp. NPDC059866]|uniref:hypothetical protein n=1 Tax=Streptomyces sp. NPDC059866 TaxID=3346978 RepID=UPI00365E005E